MEKKTKAPAPVKGAAAKMNETKTSRAGTSGDTTNDAKGSLLEEFFVNELKDIYWAEKQLVKSLTKMAREATSEELKKAFEDHQVETEDHVSRLEEIFEMLGRKAQAKKCDAMEGITREVDGIIEETEEDTYTRDAALIIGGQKAEHYEIATYGGLVQLAKVLGYEEAAELLLETLEEEKTADQLLTSIAESVINEEALAE